MNFRGAYYRGAMGTRCRLCNSDIPMFGYSWLVGGDERDGVHVCKPCYQSWELTCDAALRAVDEAFTRALEMDTK